MELVELADQGKRIARRIPVPTDPKAGIHVRYNLLQRTPAGTFLLALRAEQAFIEVDDAGRELWRQAVPGMTTVAERLSSGNTLMGWRGQGKTSSGGLIEVDPQGLVVWKLDVGEVGGLSRLVRRVPPVREWQHARRQLRLALPRAQGDGSAARRGHSRQAGGVEARRGKVFRQEARLARAGHRARRAADHRRPVARRSGPLIIAAKQWCRARIVIPPALALAPRRTKRSRRRDRIVP